MNLSADLPHCLKVVNACHRPFIVQPMQLSTIKRTLDNQLQLCSIRDIHHRLHLRQTFQEAMGIPDQTSLCVQIGSVVLPLETLESQGIQLPPNLEEASLMPDCLIGTRQEMMDCTRQEVVDMDRLVEEVSFHSLVDLDRLEEGDVFNSHCRRLQGRLKSAGSLRPALHLVQTRVPASSLGSGSSQLGAV